MTSLTRTLLGRVDANARAAVAAYQQVDEFRTALADPRIHGQVLEFAVHIRRRTALLLEHGEPFGPEDHAALAEAGRRRAELGISLAGHRRLLVLHGELTVREIQQAVDPADVGGWLRSLTWVSEQGAAGAETYLSAFLSRQQGSLSLGAQVRRLGGLVADDDPLAGHLASRLSFPLAGARLVAALRTPVPPVVARDETAAALFRRHRMLVSWPAADQCLAFLPAADPGPALAAIRDLVEQLHRPCAVGTAGWTAGPASEAVALARQISLASPVETAVERLRTMADVFVEMAVDRVPSAARWLRELTDRLAEGPDLVVTLQAYYRHDLSRARTAAALHIHPRTLDYRLGRAAELTGVDPASTHGIRVLSTAVARALANPDS